MMQRCIIQEASGAVTHMYNLSMWITDPFVKVACEPKPKRITANYFPSRAT
jgi:hypothetical protein